MRFNPPPNWPPVPPGWAPDSNWAPDPSWPPPPPGWPLWVDDAEGAVPQFPPGQLPPYQYQPPYPPYAGPWQPWPPPPPRPTSSRRLLWMTLAAVGLVLVVGVGLVVGFGARLVQTGEKPSKKPDITDLTSGLLVDRSAFPDISGGKWISGVNSNESAQSSMPNLTIDPPECADLYGDSKDATQTATATLANIQPGGLHSMRMHLAVTPRERNLKEYLQKCRSFTQTVQSGSHTVSTEVRLDPLDAAGVPPWAVATVMSSSSSTAVRLPISVTAATVAGYYRGVLVVASSNDIRLRPKNDSSVDADNSSDLVNLFNAQVEKLEAAP